MASRIGFAIFMVNVNINNFNVTRLIKIVQHVHAIQHDTILTDVWATIASMIDLCSWDVRMLQSLMQGPYISGQDLHQ